MRVIRLFQVVKVTILIVLPSLWWHMIANPHLSLVKNYAVLSRSTVTPKLKLHHYNEVVLLTGAAGYIGSHTALQLLEDGHTVIGLDNISRGSEKALNLLSTLFPQDFAFERVDIGNADAIDRVFRKYKISVVIHLAAVPFVGESVKFPEIYYQNITFNTQLLVDKMMFHNVNRIVFASSSAVYGIPHKQPVSEEMTPYPLSPYGHAKLDAENYLVSIHQSKSLRGFILRYFNVIGADSKGRLGENSPPEACMYARLWSNCSEAIQGRIPCLEVLKGASTGDFVHVEDIARANVGAMVASRQDDSSAVEILNVASNTETSLDLFASLAEQVSNADIIICNHTTANQRLRKGNEFIGLYGSSDKIKERIGWTPHYTNVTEMLTTSWKYSLAKSCDEQEKTFHAVLISGQCQRFNYRDQSGPLLRHTNPLCGPKIDVYITLHCGKLAKPWTGQVEAPPYINVTNLNVTDIEYWFASVRGANTVQIKIFDDMAMYAIDQELFSYATDIHVGETEKAVLQQFVNGHMERRWRSNSRMFFLRHVAFSMSIGGSSYTGYTYWREDNYFFSPLDITGIDFNNYTHPYVIVDIPCEFGSYSDKIYVMNREGAELLFDSTRTYFLEKVKKWVLFAKLIGKGDAFQSEKFLHDTLSAAVVEKRGFMRADTRYQDGKLCIPGVYYRCYPKEVHDAAALVGLSKC